MGAKITAACIVSYKNMKIDPKSILPKLSSSKKIGFLCGYKGFRIHVYNSNSHLNNKRNNEIYFSVFQEETS